MNKRTCLIHLPFLAFTLAASAQTNNTMAEGGNSQGYDMAPENPKIVAEIRSRVERLLGGFPEEVRKAYRDTMALEVGPSEVGQVPLLKKK